MLKNAFIAFMILIGLPIIVPTVFIVFCVKIGIHTAYALLTQVISRIS